MQTIQADWWRRVLDAADRALQLDAQARAAFLEQCAADDPSLGAEVRALLGRADEASVLDAAAADFASPLVNAMASTSGVGAADPRLDDGTGSGRFGSYRIVREIGRGGMGRVFLGERVDGAFEQRVALKLLPPWSAADQRRVQRFLEERQILAALDHPGIARLVDGGVTPEGLPWFAMEYVDGLPLDRYCDERRLPVEARLALFCEVCAAVQYAHRNLVVHRDLKPANILVTAERRVRLLDFGIAKLLADHPTTIGTLPADLTVTGERLLTPLYASPEQIQGTPVSTATDVYALGVLLHLLLTGTSPYRLTTLAQHEVARAVLEQDPLRPSAAVLRAGGLPAEYGLVEAPEDRATARDTSPVRLARRLRGDLDAIVLKAVEKQPVRRYGSAEQLEADVRRHLAGLPVAARPVTRAYLARTFVRRHRVAVAVATGVTALVFGFTVVTAVQSARIHAQAQRIAAERDKAEQLTAFLTTLFRDTRPNSSDRGVTARDLLDTATVRIDQQRFPDPEQRARLMLEMARAYLQLDLPDRARVLAEGSLTLRRGREPRRDVDVAASSQMLGDVLLAQGQLESAGAAYGEALALRRQALGAWDGEVARSLAGLASVRRAQRRLAEAESLARVAVSIDGARRGDARTDLAQSTSALARVLLDKADYREAARLFERVLALARETHPEEHVEVAGAIFDLATALQGAGQQRHADSLLSYGRGLYERLLTTTVLGIALGAPATGSTSGTVARIFNRAMVGPGGDTSGAGATRTTPATRAVTDESQILFISDRERPDPVGDFGATDIYVMKSDGTEERRLTHAGTIMLEAAFSPDGQQVAFASRQGGGLDVFLMNTDGTGQRQLTDLSRAGLGAYRPAWSPDGKRIAFQSWRNPSDVYVVNIDGSGLLNLTDPSDGGAPTWSPDGRRIAFQSTRDGDFEIYLLDPDGGNLVQLTFNDARDLRPTWSPDGRRIAFQSDRDGDREVYVMNADGSNQVRLTRNPGEDGYAAWSPDGRRIVFHRRVLGHMQVYVMNADGSGVRRLTELSTVAYNGFPTWGPARPASAARAAVSRPR